MARNRSCAIALLALLLVAIGAPARAQDFRGTLVGKVTDVTGAILPGVTVVVTNNDTKISQTVITDKDGTYRVPFLNVGVYTVTVSLSGFKKIERPKMEVKVGDAARADFALEPGPQTEVIQVTAETPLLNTTTGVSGLTIDAKQIAQLPLGDGTAYMLTRLAPGIMDTSDLHFSRPMDNGNLSGITANGVQGGNEFTIDGTSNLSNTRGVGFSPPSGAIGQFKVQTNGFDAQYGHTAGAVVNLALRSGTNAFRGEAGYYNRDDSRSATPLLTQRAGGTKPTRQYNRTTGTIAGPIVKNRTFFMFSAEHLKDIQPEPATFTVPTLKMRSGDFSEFTTLVYDPRTAANIGGTITRQPFQNNQIPADRINAVAAAYASYYPEPNLPGTVANYFTNMLRPYDYDATVARVDHNISEANRIWASGYYNTRQEDRYNWALGAPNSPDGLINGFPITQGFDYRSNTGINAGWTWARRDASVFDVRVGYTQFGEHRDPAANFDPSSLGFSATTDSLMAGYQILPLMTFGSFSTTNQNSTIASLGTQRSDWREGYNRPMTNITIAPVLTRILKAHALRAGYEWRYQKWQITDTGYPVGRYSFNGAYTRANNSAATNDRAQSWAQFLLGLPTSGTNTTANASSTSSQFEITSPGDYRQSQHGFFIQDDWTVNGRLTLNLGVRFEVNTGMSEVLNRNLAGFDTTVDSPIEAAAQAAYALNPIPQIPVNQFQVNGGLLFADGPINNTASKALPRGSAAFLLNDKTVLRGGIGMFSYDYFFENINQIGYSQSTPVIVTNDNGLTFTGADLTNPIPSGQLIQPVGNSLGLSSQLGQALGTIYQPDRATPYYTRWEASVQRELPYRMLVTVTYLASRGTSIPVVRAVNNVPLEFLSTSRQDDPVNDKVLSGNVTNPFAGLLPGSTINGATVARSQVLRPYPQFLAFSIEQYDGSDRYDALSLQFDKRFAGANSLTVQYTRSKTTDTLNYLNPQDNTLEDRISPNDRPNRLSIGASLGLPFGHDGHWGKNWNDFTEAFLGGWRVSGTYQYQSGFPLTFTSNGVYWDESCGDPKNLKSYIGKKIDGKIAGLDVPGWDLSCFYFHDAAVQTNGVDDPVKQRADPRINVANNVRYFPSTLPGVRSDQLHLLDMSIGKEFATGHGTKLQFRVEVINALNYTVLWNPGVDPRATNGLFGFVNTDRNNPRDVQLGLRFTF